MLNNASFASCSWRKLDTRELGVAFTMQPTWRLWHCCKAKMWVLCVCMWTGQLFSSQLLKPITVSEDKAKDSHCALYLLSLLHSHSQRTIIHFSSYHVWLYYIWGTQQAAVDLESAMKNLWHSAEWKLPRIAAVQKQTEWKHKKTGLTQRSKCW